MNGRVADYGACTGLVGGDSANYGSCSADVFRRIIEDLWTISSEDAMRSLIKAL